MSERPQVWACEVLRAEGMVWRYSIEPAGTLHTPESCAEVLVLSYDVTLFEARTLMMSARLDRLAVLVTASEPMRRTIEVAGRVLPRVRSGRTARLLLMALLVAVLVLAVGAVIGRAVDALPCTSSTGQPCTEETP